MLVEDLYSLLGLDSRATAQSIHRAFRKLTRKCHPEVNPGDEGAAVRYRMLCLAHEILYDAGRRAEYNRLGHREFFLRYPQGLEQPAARKEEDFLSELVREGFIGEILGLRPKGPAGSRPLRGEDIRYYLPLTFFESVKGHESTVEITRKVDCPQCGGIGAETGSRKEGCPRCRGAGIVVHSLGPLVTERECAACLGRGYVIRRACRICRGTGKVEKKVAVKVRIPPGVFSGSEVKVRGLGHEGAHGGPPGDLVVITRVEEHPLFVRKGDNIYTVVPVMAWEAALGGEIMVATLDGKIPLSISPGTQAGKQFKLPGQGVPNIKTGKRGDHFVEIKVVVPAPADEEAMKAYRKLAEIFRRHPREG